jgi:hypothetical protein
MHACVYMLGQGVLYAILVTLLRFESSSGPKLVSSVQNEVVCCLIARDAEVAGPRAARLGGLEVVPIPHSTVFGRLPEKALSQRQLIFHPRLHCRHSCGATNTLSIHYLFIQCCSNSTSHQRTSHPAVLTKVTSAIMALRLSQKDKSNGLVNCFTEGVRFNDCIRC